MSQGRADVVAERSGGPTTDLQHGRWSLQVRGDEVADLRFDGVLLLRAVRPVVRDADWNTVPVRVVGPTTGGPSTGSGHEEVGPSTGSGHEEVGPSTGSGGGGSGSGREDGTVLRRTLRFEDAGVHYAGELTVTLDDGSLVVDFAGEARSAFRRNRVGLVVLHPAADAGTPVRVRHSDGEVEDGRWPVAISPHQPFVDVVGFGWTRDGVTARLDLEGDVFETEDQRNWTDASFKTYSTPLARPFPVPLAVGDRVHQAVRLEVSGRGTRPAAAPGPDVVRVGGGTAGTVPPLGLGAALHPPPTEPLAVPGFDAVLVELTGPDAGWPELLAEAGRQATALAAGLDVRLITDDPEVVRRTVRALTGHPVLRLAALDTAGHLSTAPLWAALRDEAQQQGSTATLLGGTRAHFTELNRRQADLPADAPALTFSLTPQMHASEVPHVVDSLTTQRTVVENAVRIAAGRPLHVGPVTLARRFNAVATGERADPATDAAEAVDPLLDTPLAAGWTLASVAALAVPGVASLSYLETVGPRGLVHEDGRPRPVAAVLTRLAALRGRPLREVAVPDGLAALAVDEAAGPVVLLANLTAGRREVEVRAAGGSSTAVALPGWGTAEVRLG